MDVRVISGINLVQVAADVNALQSTHKPIGGLYYKDGLYFQSVIEGTPSAMYVILDCSNDVEFAQRASAVTAQPLGQAILHRSRIIQAFGATPIGNTVNVDDLAGTGATGLEILKADTPEDVRAVMPFVVNEVFRGSFTTAAGELTQLVTTANTMHVITFNTQQIPNTALGTLNNATGVFTAAKDINGLLTVNAQIRRGLAGTTIWTVQVETSPDGSVWTPVAGSSRRITLGAGENNLVRFYDFTVATALPTGTQLRFTQSVSDATNNTGLVALAAAVGGTTSAGFIFSLYTTQ